MTNSLKKQALLGTAFVALSMTALQPAFAQDDAEDGDTIVVTGSRLSKSDSYSGIGPVSVFGSEEIEASGTPNIGEFLQEIPAAQSLGSDGTFVNNGSSGVTTLNLRGIGTERNLTLFNGRRVAPAGTGIDNIVDLSIFPTALLDRVEVLLDGASATYGSDAIAGVVNIITKDDFEGMSANMRYGVSEQSDANVFQADLAMGTAYDRGSFVFGFTYAEQQPLFQNERDISDCPEIEPLYNYLFTVYGSFFGVDPNTAPRGAGGGGFCSGSSFIPSGRFYTSSGSQTIDANGNPTPFSFFRDFYNFNPLNYLIAPRETISTYFHGDYEVNENLTLDMELLYAKRFSKQQLAPVPLGRGAQINTPGLVIPAGNPFNPFGEDVEYRKRMLDVGPRKPDQEADTIRAVIGAEGTFGGSGWDYSAYYSYENFLSANSTDNLIDMSRVQQALDVVPTTVSGAGVVTVGGTNYWCADSAARSLGCEPLNFFGEGSITPGAADFIGFKANNILKNESNSLAFYLTKNDFWSLPAGDVGISAGVEYRDVSGSDNVDSITVAGNSSGNPRNSTSGSYSATDVFIETHVPLISGKQFFEELSFDGAVRRTDYSSFDSKEVWRAGLSWVPTADLRFRASTSTSFRAPSLNDLFNGGSGGFPTYQDPCRAAVYSAITDPVQQANVLAQCAAEGVDATTFVSNNNQVLSFSAGNPNLLPERGQSFTAGMVYQASSGMLADYDFRASIDFWSLKLKDAITGSGTQATINNCYLNADPNACANVERQTGGDLLRVFTRNINSESNDYYEGVDFRFDAGREVGPGFLKGNLVGTYLIENTTTDQNGTSRDFVGNCYGFTVSCYNRVRINTYLDYSWSDWSVRWSTRYLDATEAQPAGVGDPAYDPNVYEVDAFWYHNLGVGYEVNDNVNVSFYVDNLFDKQPPYYKDFGGFFTPTENTPLGTYDVVGRYYSFRIGADF